MLGRDLSRDMAVLRIERNGIAPVELATAEPRVGTLTMAVGRPFIPSTQASLGTVVFVGSIRFRNYRTGRMIHADPTMYPGFSGGPLISSAGSVYGINTSGAVPGGRDHDPGRTRSAGSWPTSSSMVSCKPPGWGSPCSRWT